MFEDWEEEEEASETEIQREPEVLAIGGGKGGVGKTVISASMGVGMAALRKHVVLVDADLGGADLHRAMGLEKPDRTILDFIRRRYDSLQEILVDVPGVPHLRLACGAEGSLGMANLPLFQKKKLIRHIRQLNADAVLLDLGAGTTYHMLDFFLAVDRGIVIVKPDPLSILESYHFIKLAVFRKIALLIRRHDDARSLVREVARIETGRDSMTVSDLLGEMRKLDGELAFRIERFLASFHPMLLVNMKSDDRDEANVLGIRTAAAELLSVELRYLGAIRKDDAVNDALANGMPFLRHDRGCDASKDLTQILVNRLLDRGWLESIRDRRSLRKGLEAAREDSRKVIICSVRCMYWEDCDFREGGFPCALQHFRGIDGFHGDPVAR